MATPIDMSYFLATKRTQSLLGLDDDQRRVLERELTRTDDEDARLVLRLNPEWQGSDAVVPAVCDAFATFAMPPGNARRDAEDGCHRWLFRFEHYQDLSACKQHVEQPYEEAFCVRFKPSSLPWEKPRQQQLGYARRH